MPLRIAKDGELSVHQQLRQQIIFQITTGELPIGHPMPSLNQLQRDLKISRNTVDRVYDELVAQRWLYPQKCRPPVVAYPKVSSLADGDNSLDVLIDRVVTTAQSQGLSLDELTARITSQAKAPPPDHFLVVEPEPGIGQVIRYEVFQATGNKSVSYSVSELRGRPELLEGAALLVPAYLADLLDFVPAKQRAAMTLLVYTPFGGYIEDVRKLPKPSLIGMISVSGPGMKTMVGVFAQAVSSRHKLMPFFMEWPPPKTSRKPVIKRVKCQELPPDIDVRRTGLEKLSSREPRSAQVAPKSGWHDKLPLATKADLRSVDVLFCDSITSNYVNHPGCLKYHLLSDESLKLVSAVRLASKVTPTS